MEQILEDYQSQRDNVDIEDYINHLKQVDNQLDKQADAKDQSKEEYKTFKDRLSKVRMMLKAKSPFTDEMIEDYRKELTKSMRAQLDDNQDLKDALQQIKDDKQKMQDTMINHLRNDIEKTK